MTRRSITDYCGAAGRLDITKVSKLDRSRFVVQEKHDGCYVQISTDAAGRVVNVLSRAGQPMREAADLIGIRFIPNATIAAELEAHTEAGNRIAATRGYRLAHVFDAIRLHGSYLARTVYRDRRDMLHQAIAIVELREGNGRHWTEDDNDRAHDARGRFTRRVPRSWRRFPLVADLPLHEAHDLYERARADGDIEGAVIIDQWAPLGARGGKRKLKPVRTIDAVVVQSDKRRAVCSWAGHVFVVGIGDRDIKPGAIIECIADGFYESKPTPRFVRVRRDLEVRS